MSTSTKSMNNNTSTSNSRSGKKPSKKVQSPVEQVAQPETVVSTPVEVVENTVSATDITPPKTEEVVSDASTSDSSDPTVPAEPKPVVNIWELRKQARAAEEALKKANEAIEKIATETEKPVSKPAGKPKPELKSESKPVVASDESEGFTKVQYKKKPAPKSAPKAVTKAAPSSEPKTAKDASSETKPSSAKPGKSSYKPKPKEPSDDQVAYRERKNKALILAQDQLIGECVAQLHPKVRDDINNSMPYIINYRRTLVVKFDTDSVVAEVEGEKFEFSRTRFFENRIFQDKVREKYETLIPAAWLRFFPGRDENTYCMGVMKRRAEADA